jgi:hypothetical protein
MKNSKLLFLLPFLAIVLLTACQPKDEKTLGASLPVTEVGNPGGDSMTAAVPVTSEITSIAFAEKAHSFGEVAMGDKVTHRFTFKNTGDKPLILESVKPACGCTATDYTKEPIAPGAEGYVETVMEAKSVGIFKKTVAVTTNTDPRNHQLEFSGEVME